MGTYFNLRTSLSGNDVCDKTVKYVVADGKIIKYRGKPRGILRRRFDYSEEKIRKITKSTKVEDEDPLIFPTGSGMINIGGLQYHIFGNVQGFINDVKTQIQMANE
ncbi:MAG: hypothetical protein KTR29_06795 [Rhodothermaceae bacterium]|nr:hypothetical protein [Rhodothermaceae bacterium]